MKKRDYNDNKNVIYNRLKFYRLQQGVTQKELAARLQTMNVSIDQQMISKMENNTRIVTDYELVCLSKALHVPLEELIDMELVK